MRLLKFLNEENMVKKALSIDEPKVNGDYDEVEVADNLEAIRIAIGKQTEEIAKLRKSGSDESLKAARAVLSDLKDKEDKWSNWEKEVKSKGPNPPPEGAPEEEAPEEEAPEEEEEEEAPEEEEEEEEDK